MPPSLASEEAARIRAALAFAEATQAPPEARAWLIRMFREAEERRAAQAREVLAPLLPKAAAEPFGVLREPPVGPGT